MRGVKGKRKKLNLTGGKKKIIRKGTRGIKKKNLLGGKGKKKKIMNARRWRHWREGERQPRTKNRPIKGLKS